MSDPNRAATPRRHGRRARQLTPEEQAQLEATGPQPIVTGEGAAQVPAVRGAMPRPGADAPLPTVRKFGKRARIIELDPAPEDESGQQAPTDPTAESPTEQQAHEHRHAAPVAPTQEDEPEETASDETAAEEPETPDEPEAPTSALDSEPATDVLGPVDLPEDESHEDGSPELGEDDAPVAEHPDSDASQLLDDGREPSGQTPPYGTAVVDDDPTTVLEPTTDAEPAEVAAIEGEPDTEGEPETEAEPVTEAEPAAAPAEPVATAEPSAFPEPSAPSAPIARDQDGVELGELTDGRAPGPRPAPRFDGKVLSRPEQSNGKPLVWAIWIIIAVAVVALIVLLLTGVIGPDTVNSAAGMLPIGPEASTLAHSPLLEVTTA